MKKSYLITGIEPKLLNQFKAACAHYDRSMRDSFIHHMNIVVSTFDFDEWSKDETEHKPSKGGKKK